MMDAQDPRLIELAAARAALSLIAVGSNEWFAAQDRVLRASAAVDAVHHAEQLAQRRGE